MSLESSATNASPLRKLPSTKSWKNSCARARSASSTWAGGFSPGVCARHSPAHKQSVVKRSMSTIVTNDTAGRSDRRHRPRRFANDRVGVGAQATKHSGMTASDHHETCVRLVRGGAYCMRHFARLDPDFPFGSQAFPQVLDAVVRFVDDVSAPFRIEVESTNGNRRHGNDMDDVQIGAVLVRKAGRPFQHRAAVGAQIYGAQNPAEADLPIRRSFLHVRARPDRATGVVQYFRGYRA